jgi:hypothetical protein
MSAGLSMRPAGGSRGGGAGARREANVDGTQSTREPEDQRVSSEPSGPLVLWCSGPLVLWVKSTPVCRWRRSRGRHQSGSSLNKDKVEIRMANLLAFSMDLAAQIRLLMRFAGVETYTEHTRPAGWRLPDSVMFSDMRS